MPGSLTARDVSKSYAAATVLDGISLVVAPSARARPSRCSRREVSTA